MLLNQIKTKIDDGFPNRNFLIDEFSTPHRLDRNSNGGRIMLLVREDIRSNLVEGEANPIEGFL